MKPPGQPLFRLDFRIPRMPQAAVSARHLGLGIAAAGALLAVYALINALSASINKTPAPPPAATVAAPVPALAVSDAPAEVDAVADAPAVAAEADYDAPEVLPEYEWTTATVRRGDTLSRIFKRHGLKVTDAYAAAELTGAAALRKIRPGEEIRLAADDAGRLAALRYALDAFSMLAVERAADGLSAEIITRTPERRERAATGVIHSNLLDAAGAAGVDLKIIHAFAHLFGWQVDFARQIHPGDRFSVLYEEFHLDGERAASGDILAAELVLSGKRLRAARYLDADGRSAYYTPEGGGIQRSFLRSPLSFARVTSGFSNNRFHPIFKEFRAHRGVDYGAPTGTPVRATGDGVVAQAGRRQGYGKTIVLRHGATYTTLYAHLSRFAKGVKRGAKVRQGEVIGYVGNTGWSTGPHLHYEFRINGVHHNPVTVELPTSDPIAAELLPDFIAQTGGWMARLDHIGAVAVAQLEGLESAR